MHWKAQLFGKKSIETLLHEMAGENRLRRVLGPISLTSLGIGAIIGAGIFVMTGRAAAVDFFTKVLKRQPKPIPETIGLPIVSVVAQGDMVIVASPRVFKDPKDEGKTYTSTWFDMWRIKDGKADEHWDCATKI